jgi:RNA polymerase primary sigma factor
MSNAEDHIGLVYSIAQELANTEEVCIRAFGRDVSEYLGEGFLALQTAKKNFKPELGWKFSTYASEVIRDRLIQAARRSTLIKVSYQARYQAARAIQGKEIKPEDEQKVKDALKIMRNGIVPILDVNEKGDNDGTPTWEIAEELNTRLDKLDERTRTVLVMRYGLDGNEPLTLEEVGKKLDPPVTRERVRQIEKLGLTKLKEVVNF